MTQEERLEYLLRTLLAEQPSYREPRIPMEKEEKKRLLRALFNVRPPWPISGEFLRVQDAYLREETLRKGITEATAMEYYAIMQEMFNGYFSSPAYAGKDFMVKIADHEEKLAQMLDILLYGLAKKEKT